MFLEKKILFLKNFFVSLNKITSENLWSEVWKGGFPLMLILGLLGKYVLWCCGGICHQPDTFIKIGSGHTVFSWYDIFWLVQKLLSNFHFTFWQTDTCSCQRNKKTVSAYVTLVGAFTSFKTWLSKDSDKNSLECLILGI